MATVNETSNKPTLAKLNAFAISNSIHSIVYINTGFSNRQPPEISIPGFHNSKLNAKFYLAGGQEESFRNAMRKVPLLPVDITFSGMDGKTIGYYPKERASNDGGGNVKSSAINPQTMQDFFSVCDMTEENDTYIMLPTLKFYNKVLTYDMLKNVLEHDFATIPDVSDLAHNAHIFVDSSSFFSISDFSLSKDDAIWKALSKLDNIDSSIKAYLNDKPNLFGAYWIYNAMIKGYKIHLFHNISIINVVAQFAFGMKSEDKQVVFSEFIELSSDKTIIHSEASNYNINTTSRTRGRINIETTSSGFDNIWIIAIIPGIVENVEFLGSTIDISAPSDEQLADLEDCNIESSLELYQYSNRFSEVPDDASRETKNQMLKDHALQIVETLHCSIKQVKKKVRFDENEVQNPIQKLSKTLINVARANFATHIVSFNSVTT